MDTSELQAENFGKFLEDGPRLRSDYNVWIVAKDSKNDMVLLGGLGAMGVGEMWIKVSDRHRNYPNFDDAPEEDAASFMLGFVQTI